MPEVCIISNSPLIILLLWLSNTCNIAPMVRTPATCSLVRITWMVMSWGGTER